MTKIEKWRSLRKLPLATAAGLKIAKGGHKNREDGLCVMELVAHIAGEPHTDHPECVSPVIGAFLRSWNDALPDKDRTRLLRPLLTVVIGTKASAKVEQRRAWLALDWYVRSSTSAWLRAAKLDIHADAIAALRELRDEASAKAAMPALSTAAWSAAVNAAVNAAGSAAWSAAVSAAGSAAWSAAVSAAWSAAVSAAGSAAVWSAAVSAARDRLAPTVKLLQASAQDLVRRMCEVKD